jgi:hypothetical protein
MNAGVRRARPSWRNPETRGIRMEVVVLAMVVVGALLVEVWQTTRMAELRLALDGARAEHAQQIARLEFDRANLVRHLTRAQLEPHAKRLALAPVSSAQVVELPATYLAHGETVPGTGSVPEPSWIARAARALVPEATARSRNGS